MVTLSGYPTQRCETTEALENYTLTQACTRELLRGTSEDVAARNDALSRLTLVQLANTSSIIELSPDKAGPS